MEEENKQKKSDKRSITSKLNLQKARATRLQQLKDKKELSKYPIYDSSDSSSDESDYEEIVIKPTKGKSYKSNYDGDLRNEINELRNMIFQLSKSGKSKPKKKEAPKVVQIIKEKEIENAKKSSNPLKEELIKAFFGEK